MKGHWGFDTITYDMARKYHRYLWRWLAKHPTSEKWGWPGWVRFEWGYGGYVPNNCFACHVADKNSPVDGFCGHCPIGEWSLAYAEAAMMKKHVGPPCQEVEYGMFLVAQLQGNKKEASRLALIIAEKQWLPHDEYNRQHGI